MIERKTECLYLRAYLREETYKAIFMVERRKM